ncbi:MAG TPA: hypothetical protein VLK33_20540 [Terriglobales bacterium]|nr:hypothetical protein [Terriglobales bacterium]
MRLLSILWLVFYSMHCVGQIPSFTNDEAKPLLDVVSKLQTVVVAKPSSYSALKWPQICWLDADEFRELDQVVEKYPGTGQWYFVKDLPRRCLVVEPDILRGEPIPINKEFRPEASAQFNQMEKNLQNRGINAHIPLSFTEPQDFRSSMVREIQALASFINQNLQLEGKSSFGIQFSDQEFLLPLMEDQKGPGSGIILAADPIKFSSFHTLTSPNDRTLHFWITEDESQELWSEISKDQNENVEESWPFLSKMVEAKYGGLVILPSEIADLAAEGNKLKLQTNSLSLKDALNRVLSVCKSAQNYSLGLFLPGE